MHKFEFTKKENGYSVWVKLCKLDPKCVEEINIPSYHNGLPVIEIFGIRETEDVDYLFGERYKIKIFVPNGVKSILGSALLWTKIVEISIPSSVENIYCDYFSTMSCSEKVVISPFNKKYMMVDDFLCSADEKILYKMINDRFSAKQIINIPDMVEVIETNAFENVKFKTINFQETKLRQIKNHAFAGAGLTEAILPDTLEYVGVEAFFGCNKLKKVYIPKNVKVDKSAFVGCHKATIYCEGGEIDVSKYKWYSKGTTVIYNCKSNENDKMFVDDIKNDKKMPLPTDESLCEAPKDVLEEIKACLSETGVKTAVKKKKGGKIDIEFTYQAHLMTLSIGSSEHIDALVMFLICLYNFDFKTCVEILNDENCRNGIIKEKKFIFDTFFKLSQLEICLNAYVTKTIKNLDVDSYLELFTLFEKYGFDINKLREPLKDVNLFTLFTLSFLYVENKKDYEINKKIFYYLLNNSEIKKDTAQAFLGSPADILETVVDDECCPDRYEMLEDLNRVLLKNESKFGKNVVAIQTEFGTLQKDMKTGNAKFITDKVKEVDYDNEKNNFGLIICESSVKVENKQKEFSVPVRLKFTSTPKSEEFDYSQLKYRFDNCRFIGTSFPDTFTILFDGPITLYGYTGTVKLELALHMNEKYFYKIDKVILNNVNYKYNGVYLDLDFQFSIK